MGDEEQMSAKYKNPWFNTGKDNGPELFECDKDPVEYNGCLIYEREEFGYKVFDVVKDGICVAQRAGPRGAREAVDNKSWEEREWWKKRGVKQCV